MPKVAVTASFQFDPEGQTTHPSVGPFPFNYTALDQKEPFVTTVEVLPGDTFVGGEKVVDIPTHLQANQDYVLIKTDLPVKVRVRDTDPTEFERQLRTEGHLAVGGGDPPIDRVSFEGIAQSQPSAKVTLIVSAR